MNAYTMMRTIALILMGYVAADIEARKTLKMLTRKNKNA